MPKTNKDQRLGKRNRKEKREHFKNAGVIHGYKAKRNMQGGKKAVIGGKSSLPARKVF